MVTETDESSDDQDEDDADEALDDAAQGVSGTSDETADGSGEIDAIGHAAGLVVKDGDRRGGPSRRASLGERSPILGRRGVDAMK
ncbi:MAG TPA: hypothetical protein VGO00_05895 [Kofleriaceae bacterium]|nr:hypothetical protein [Kofleriaceae bacterium]